MREVVPGDLGQRRRGPARWMVLAIHGYPSSGLRAGRPTGCRYLPTCSDYALQAVERHGAVHGGALALETIDAL